MKNGNLISSATVCLWLLIGFLPCLGNARTLPSLADQEKPAITSTSAWSPENPVSFARILEYLYQSVLPGIGALSGTELSPSLLLWNMDSFEWLKSRTYGGESGFMIQNGEIRH